MRRRTRGGAFAPPLSVPASQLGRQKKAVYISTRYMPEYRKAMKGVRKFKRRGILSSNMALSLIVSVLMLSHAVPTVTEARGVYITQNQGVQVTVIDSETFNAADPIDIQGYNPISAAMTPDGKEVYVVHEGLPVVSVLDTQTNDVDVIGISSTASSVAVAPDGEKAYVTSYESGSLYVIDTVTRRVDSIYVGSGIADLAITPNGTRVYLANFNSGRVLILETEGSTVLDEQVQVGIAPNGLAITPDGSKVYVANINSDAGAVVSVIDTVSNQVVETVSNGILPGPSSVEINSTGDRAYVASTPGSVSTIDTESDTVIADPVVVAAGVYGIDVTPDDKKAFVTSLDSNIVSVVDLTNNELIGQIDIEDGPRGVAAKTNQGPTARLSVTPAGAGKSTVLDASGSSDPDGTVAKYEWEVW